MLNLIHSRFIKLLLVGSIISASVPSTKVEANWFWPKSKTQAALTLSVVAVCACTAAFCIWHFFIKPRLNHNNPPKPPLPPKPSETPTTIDPLAPQQNQVVQNSPLAQEMGPVTIYTFDQWKNKCDALPAYSNGNYSNTALTENEFVGTIVKFIEVLKTQLSAKKFIGQQTGFSDEDFNIEKNKVIADDYIHIEKFYVQKLNLPKDAKLFMHGDIHADVHSLIKYLSELKEKGIIGDNFEIIDKKNYIAFLGDYTDRGNYGAEVLYTIMRLKIANPENVIMLRGNHEALDINTIYGFYSEIIKKFKLNFTKKMGFKVDIYDPAILHPIEIIKVNVGGVDLNYLLTKLYNLLPSAAFTCILPEDPTAKKEYSILCHAGIEPRFNPKTLLSTNGDCLFQKLDKLNNWVDDEMKQRLQYILPEIENNFTHEANGFLWNDFYDNKDYGTRPSTRGAGIETSHKDMLKYFEKCSSEKDGYIVNRMFKGHQHASPIFEKTIQFGGVYNIFGDDSEQWNKTPNIGINLENKKNTVHFLNVGPDSDYGQRANYLFDHYSVLKKKPNSDQLCLEPHQVEVLDKDRKLILDKKPQALPVLEN